MRNPAGPIESGERYHLGITGYRWARRVVNWWKVDGGREELVLNVSRCTDGPRADVSIVLFFGDPNDLRQPGAQMSQQEFRERLVAIGCDWAAEPVGRGAP